MKIDWSQLVAKLDSDIARTARRLEELRAARAAVIPLAGSVTAGRAGRRPRVVRAVASAPVRIPAGSRFWLRVLGAEARTGPEIVDIALATLALGETDREAVHAEAARWFGDAVERSLVEIVGSRSGQHLFKRT